MRRSFIGMAALLLVGCDKADNAPGPGGVTVGEARALDEAAQMLEERRTPPEILNPTTSPPDAMVGEGGSPAE
ncbi:hypothetical protein [Novosphingobium sp. M1R2S20]|uniref:Lipoprotein n=1 Tax=Novosphingobium rhizovicinum TaxID=3228928 RepID=A0ABV3RA84_9SPHN